MGLLRISQRRQNQDGLRELNEVLRAMLDGKFVTPRRAEDLKNQQYVSLRCVGAYATPIALKNRDRKSVV